LDAARSLLSAQLHEFRDLLAARSTPSRPEVHDERPAAELLHRHRLAVEPGQRSREERRGVDALSGMRGGGKQAEAQDRGEFANHGATLSLKTRSLERALERPFQQARGRARTLA